MKYNQLFYRKRRSPGYIEAHKRKHGIPECSDKMNDTGWIRSRKRNQRYELVVMRVEVVVTSAELVFVLLARFTSRSFLKTSWLTDVFLAVI